jgi:hypothetical protein
MAYWLVKSEPDAFSWDQQAAKGFEPWTGVRNAQASNNLKAMRRGDRAFFSDIPQMAGGFAGSERMVAIARASRQRFWRSERCRGPCNGAMMASSARLPLQTLSFGRASPADLQAGRLRR